MSDLSIGTNEFVQLSWSYSASNFFWKMSPVFEIHCMHKSIGPYPNTKFLLTKMNNGFDDSSLTYYWIVVYPHRSPSEHVT